MRLNPLGKSSKVLFNFCKALSERIKMRPPCLGAPFGFGEANAISVHVVLTRCTFIQDYKNENGLDLRLKLLSYLPEAQESGLHLF